MRDFDAWFKKHENQLRQHVRGWTFVDGTSIVALGVEGPGNPHSAMDFLMGKPSAGVQYVRTPVFFVMGNHKMESFELIQPPWDADANHVLYTAHMTSMWFPSTEILRAYVQLLVHEGIAPFVDEEE